jgi:deoxyribonuclease-4
MLFGAHVSVEGGLWTAFDRAEEAGCDCIQVFTKNKGAWAAKPLTDDDVKAFRERAKASSVGPIVAHAAYLLNLASPQAALRAKSTEALRVEVERCEWLGIPFLVLHPGSHTESSEEKGLARVVKGLDQVHRSTRGFKTKVLLETSAGQGSSVCHRFAGLGSILGAVKDPERLGICVDTCHIFAAGYELRTAKGYKATIDELDREVGLSRILCIHLNDSKKELGTRVDRHEHLGRGCLGREGLQRIVKDRRFAGVPFIFELPPQDDMIRKNLKVLRGLVKDPGRSRS